MRSQDVFPQSDLPGRGKEWGRVVERRVQELEKTLLALQSQTVNGLRAVSAQLDSQARSTQEFMAYRVSHTVNPVALQVVANSTTSYPIYNRAFTIPAPQDGTRMATFNVSGNFGLVSSSGDIRAFIELRRNDMVIWRNPGALILGAVPSAPPGWESSAMFSDMFSVPTSPEDTTYTFRVYAGTFIGGSIVGELNNLSVTVSYGDRI